MKIPPGSILTHIMKTTLWGDNPEIMRNPKINELSVMLLVNNNELVLIQTMRYLENSYDKTKLKIDEAIHLQRIYEDIKKKLEVVR